MKKIEKLQFITQKRTEEDILNEVAEFLEGGGKWVQLRMKFASDEEMISVGRKVGTICREAGAVFIVNDRIAVAKAVGADGVHLGKKDASTEEARQVLGKEAIIGRTANTVADIIEAAAHDIDYIGLGPYRFTTTKQNLSPMLGERGYREIFINLRAMERVNVPPVVATGGITLKDIESLAATGLYGLAVSSAISNAENPRNSAGAFLDSVDKNFKKQ